MTHVSPCRVSLVAVVLAFLGGCRGQGPSRDAGPAEDGSAPADASDAADGADVADADRGGDEPVDTGPFDLQLTAAARLPSGEPGSTLLFVAVRDAETRQLVAFVGDEENLVSEVVIEEPAAHASRRLRGPASRGIVACP